MSVWNPWHGCHKISPGCKNCYVYRMDSTFNKDSTIVTKTLNFDLPLKKKRDGRFKLEPGQTIYTCISSDFFLEEADPWRKEAWNTIRLRPDLHFFIITKRIDRLSNQLPEDWRDGYDHVSIYSTCEDQERANYRLPLLLSAPIKHKGIICEPLLGPVDLSSWLNSSIESVVVGGESGPEARLCCFDWVLEIRQQCLDHHIPFHFKQTGARFSKNGRVYHIPRKYQHSQAKKAHIDISF